MPLLRKKTFQKASMPEYLRDDEEVFHCEVTNEIFRDYEEFCERIILVNSMVWSCALTGKTNLTYAEALQSEKNARKSLRDFPQELKIPVLFLADRTKRSSFIEMTEDVFCYLKDRFFIGEIVEASFTENNWKEAHILQVIAPSETKSDIIPTKNGKSPEARYFHPPSSAYRYEIEQLSSDDQDSSEVMIAEASQIRRKKGPFSREKMKLFLKQFIETSSEGYVVIKDATKRRFKLDRVRFEQIFDGPLPDFESAKKPRLSVGKKNPRQETLAKYLKKTNTFGDQHQNAQKLLDQMKKKEEEYKLKCEEMKRKKAEEKILEKQKRKEENLKVLSSIKEWYKPRDDLELEDQKKLPEPTPVVSKIPAKYFGDSLMVLEFCNTFSTLLATKDFFPCGLTLDLVERALTEKELAGPLADIIQMLLTAIFNVQDTEAAENKGQQADLSDDFAESISLSEASQLATVASGWSKLYQGVPLSKLPLYPLTVTEILRLHLLASGARLNDTEAKWQYQQRGGYTSENDPGLALRLEHPHILKSLALHNVSQLSTGDKVKLLSCLIDQLLTYADVRDVIEEQLEKSRQIRAEVKTVQTAERKREQEFSSTRMKIKREGKGKPEEIQKELELLQLKTDKKKKENEAKMKELIQTYSQSQTVLGADRAYQKYIKIGSLPALLVENDERHYGRCLDKLVKHNPDLVDASHESTLNHVRKLLEEPNGSDKENETEVSKSPKKINGIRNSIKQEHDLDLTRELLMCTANNLPCPVHTMAEKPSWYFYYKKDDIEKLISSLNKRGIRESELRQVLETDREYLEQLISETPVSKLNPSISPKSVTAEDEETDKKRLSKKMQNMLNRYEDSNLGFTSEMDISEILCLIIIDNILEMEEKLWSGNLGALKVKDRTSWRKNLENRRFDELDKTVIKRELTNNCVENLKSEGKGSRPGTPDSIGTYRDPGRHLGTVKPDPDEVEGELEVANGEQQTTVKILATALAQVAQGIDLKHLRKPLGKADGWKKKEENFNVIERWEQSLMASTSYSQVFLHYCTLDNCIIWSRSTLLTRCRVCHRKGDNDNMLLCDGCTKGYHRHCLKPKMTSVPDGQWFCIKCKPVKKPEVPRESRRRRKIFTEESDDDEKDEDEEEEEEQENGNNEADLSLFEVCEECGSGGHVICCDFCPKVYHLECTQPPMRRVPRGEWKCHKCKRKNNNHNGKDSDSNSGEDMPERRRSNRRNEQRENTDDLPLHNVLLQELLTDVMKHKDAWPFTRPVTRLEVPDYYDIITKPMDFGTIKYKLNMGEYQCDAQIMTDAALVFDNCNTYNHSDAPVFKCGTRLLKYFEKRCSELGLHFPSGLMGETSDDEGPTKPKRSRHH